VIFEKSQVVKDDQTPYTVFTPYMKSWKALLRHDPNELDTRKSQVSNFLPLEPQAIISLESMGFTGQHPHIPPAVIPDEQLLRCYGKNRDFPAKNGTSRLSVHLRFGTISIRKLVKTALENSDTWLNELIWREFYMMILWHFPRVVDGCFRSAYNFLPWKNDEKEFERWCKGETGYPLVDAGMRELNSTGYMHNRLRMVTASFLSKHLLINWQWGEAYFAEKLMDFELSSNNGGWQWSAGCGCDAAPYFRIFNPWLQAEKFDPESKYIKKWVPEYRESSYPQPIVDHKFARQRAIETYQQVLQKQ
jgi:deoxyribodipyrimidine photo-lyase